MNGKDWGENQKRLEDCAKVADRKKLQVRKRFTRGKDPIHSSNTHASCVHLVRSLAHAHAYHHSTFGPSVKQKDKMSHSHSHCTLTLKRL